jgi:hypothetical protein
LYATKYKIGGKKKKTREEIKRDQQERGSDFLKKKKKNGTVITIINLQLHLLSCKFWLMGVPSSLNTDNIQLNN